MKKLLGIGFFALFLLISVSKGVALAVNYPNFQNRMVNDFAGILDTATKDRIEKKLRDFEKQTTNELIVAVVPNLQGENVEMFAEELFKKWGIGKKEKNNGLLLLVSMKERKWRFEVGYGLEGVLNDGKVGQIARENMVPYFKKGNFGKGIEEGLSVVMNTIIPPPPKVMSPEEIQRKREEAKAAQAAMLLKQKQEEEFAKSLVLALFIFFLAMFVVFVGYMVYQGIAKIRARRKIVNDKKGDLRLWLIDGKESLKEVSLRMKKIEQMAGLPAWINSERDDLIIKAKEILQEAEKNLASVKIANNIKELDANIEIAQEIPALISSVNKILKKLENMPDRVVQIRDKAKGETDELEEKIVNVEKLAAKMKSDGYKIDASIDEKTKKGKLFLEEMRKKMKKDDDPDLITSAAKKENATFSEIKSNLSGILSAEAEVKKKIVSLPKTVQELWEKETSVGSILNALKKDHAEDIWKSFAEKFGCLEKNFKVVYELVAAAKEKSSMKQQKFSEAVADIRKAEETVNNVRSLFNDIQSKYNEAEKAKAAYASLFAEAKEALSKAASKVKHSDVDGQRKRNVEKIKTDLLSVEKMIASNKIVDWIVVVALLAGIIAALAKVIKLAKADIAQAEESRAAIKRREEEENYHSRQSSYLTSGGGGFESSSDSSDFSCGGGESGGGGASGGW